MLAFAYYSLGLEEQRLGERGRCLECFRRGLELLNECDGAFQVLRAELRVCLHEEENGGSRFAKTEFAFYSSKKVEEGEV